MDLVFYFTATGNSLYAAKQLSDSPVSIAQVLQGSEREFTADSIGIVFPDYAAEPPMMVQKFLRECKLHTPYLYFVITYGCDVSDAPEYAEKLCREQFGLTVDYIAPMLMVDNYLPHFDMEVEMGMEKHEDEQLAKIKADIAARKREIPVATERGRELHRMVKERDKDRDINALLAVTDACTGCGLCEKVCPAQNISIADGCAKHADRCEFCLACIQLCPKNAVELVNGERNRNARFRHPKITLDEIIAANAAAN